MIVKNVIIIEDDKIFAAMFMKKLDFLTFKDDGVKLHHFESTEAAITELDKIKPEIIFLDHHLAGVNGVDAIPFIKSKSPTSDIVMVSGVTDKDLMKRAIDSGAAKYFTKDALLMDNMTGFLDEVVNRPSKFESFWAGFFANYKLDAPLKA
ncbi:MAG: response regulator of citrate/malate metabolism [Crocinitomicaceae bacterium]|jgi:response regulator of citrate/malate metabolism